MDAQAGGLRMAAQFLEMHTAGGQAGEEINSGDSPRRASSGGACESDEDHRPVIAGHHLGGGDADHPGMPFRMGQNQGLALQEVGLAGDPRLQVVPDTAFDFLAAGVQMVEGVSQPPCGVHAVGRQQVDGPAGMVDAAGGVQTRGQPKRDIVGVHRTMGDPGRLHQGGQAQPSAGSDHLQAGFRQDAVFLQQRHHVGDGAQGHQVAEGAQIGFGASGPKTGFAQASPQRDGQEEGHADAGQPTQSARAVRALGVDDRQRLRQRGAYVVVIGDNHVDPRCAGGIRGGVAVGAAIHGDYQRGPPRHGHFRDMPALQPVALRQAVRNVVGYASATGLQEFEQDGCGGRPVHVIVPEQQNVLTRGDCTNHALDCRLQVLEPGRRTQMRNRGVQKSIGLLRGGEPAVDEQGCDHGMAPEGLLEGGNGGTVHVRYLPAFFHQAALIPDPTDDLN